MVCFVGADHVFTVHVLFRVAERLVTQLYLDVDPQRSRRVWNRRRPSVVSSSRASYIRGKFTKS